MTEVFTSDESRFLQVLLQKEYDRLMTAAEAAADEACKQYHYKLASLAFDLQSKVAKHSEF